MSDKANSTFVSNDREYFSAIDGLRVCAALWVFCYHFLHTVNKYIFGDEFLVLIQSPLNTWLAIGHFGVDIFFVISGFLIGKILFQSIFERGTIDLKKFYINRALRILPVSYFFLIYGAATSYFFLGGGRELVYAIANFLFVNNYVPYKFQFMPWTWSLAVEEQFYLFYPLLLCLLPKTPRWILGSLSVLLAASFIFRYENLAFRQLSFFFGQDKYIAEAYYNKLYSATHVRYGGLVIGLLLAFVYVFKRKNFFDILSQKKWQLVTAIAAVGSFFAGFSYLLVSQIGDSLPVWYIVSYRHFVALGTAFVLALILVRSHMLWPLNQMLEHRFMHMGAQISYSFFLCNYTILSWVLYALNHFRGDYIFRYSLTVCFVIGLVASILFSLIMYFLIERPFLKRKTSLSQLHA